MRTHYNLPCLLTAKKTCAAGAVLDGVTQQDPHLRTAEIKHSVLYQEYQQVLPLNQS